MYKIIQTEKSKRDLTEISTFYISIDVNTAKKFKVEFDRIEETLKFSPEIYNVKYKSIRRVNFHTFPFCIFYEIDKNSIYVLRVLHQSRDPILWPHN